MYIKKNTLFIEIPNKCLFLQISDKFFFFPFLKYRTKHANLICGVLAQFKNIGKDVILNILSKYADHWDCIVLLNN